MAKSPPKKNNTKGGLKMTNQKKDKGQKTLAEAIEDGKVYQEAKAIKRKVLRSKAFLVSSSYE